MIKTKEDLIHLILENPENYIEDMLPKPSLEKDIYLASRILKLQWDRPFADYSETQRVRSKINREFKLLDKKEKSKLNSFITTIIGQGLPKNTFFSNADFEFDFKKNKFDLTLDDQDFKGKVFCLGTDEHYDYYVISPEFNGIRKVFHDQGSIEDIDFNNVNEFAKTVIKFALIEGSLNKGLLEKSDVELLVSNITNIELQRLVQELILN